MRLAIDLDGLLCDFNKSYVRILGEMGSPVIFPIDDPDWPPCWDYDKAAGVLQEHQDAAWAYIRKSQMFWFNIRPMRNVESDINNLRRVKLCGHDIYFVTNRPGVSAKAQSEDWLMKYGFPMPTVLVTVEGMKYLVTQALGIDACVDDKPGNLEGHGPDTKLFLFDAPYNRECDMYPRVLTVTQMLQQMGLL